MFCRVFFCFRSETDFFLNFFCDFFSHFVLFFFPYLRFYLFRGPRVNVFFTLPVLLSKTCSMMFLPFSSDNYFLFFLSNFFLIVPHPTSINQPLFFLVQIVLCVIIYLFCNLFAAPLSFWFPYFFPIIFSFLSHAFVLPYLSFPLFFFGWAQYSPISFFSSTAFLF